MFREQRGRLALPRSGLLGRGEKGGSGASSGASSPAGRAPRTCDKLPFCESGLIFSLIKLPASEVN